MNHALIIGIDKYKKSKFGDIDLSQCVYDASRVADTIFPNGPRIMLTNAAATKARALEELAAYASKLAPGDTLYYFQSSHGTYMDLTNGKRATGRVMHDAVLYDYEFFDVIKSYAAGVTVVTLSDMCHAESNSRNARLPYRTKYVEVSEEPKPHNLSIRGLKCGLLALSACGVNETAKEVPDGENYERGGVFTTALLRHKDKGISAMRAAIAKDTQPFEQRPRIERVRITAEMVNIFG